MGFIHFFKRAVVNWLSKRRHDVALSYARGDLLDIGCGYNELVKRYGKGIGVDVYDWGVPGVIVVKNASNLSFEPKSFDTVTLLACLNHIPDREGLLREVYRVLRDDGQLIVTMIGPVISRLWHAFIREEDNDQSMRQKKEGEVWGFTFSQIDAMFRQAGFRVCIHKRFIFGLNHVYVAKKVKK